MKTKSYTIQKSDLPKIAAALTEAINAVGGDTDDLHQQALEDAGLDTPLAEVVFAVVGSIDQFNPSAARIMRELGDLAA